MIPLLLSAETFGKPLFPLLSAAAAAFCYDAMLTAPYSGKATLCFRADVKFLAISAHINPDQSAAKAASVLHNRNDDGPCQTHCKVYNSGPHCN